MSLNLTVVSVDPIKRKIIQNLMDSDGKEVATLHAIRNIPDIDAAFEALHDLEDMGLVQRKVYHLGNHGKYEFYRYRTELSLLRNHENLEISQEP